MKSNKFENIYWFLAGCHVPKAAEAAATTEGALLLLASFSPAL